MDSTAVERAVERHLTAPAFGDLPKDLVQIVAFEIEDVAERALVDQALDVAKARALPEDQIRGDLAAAVGVGAVDRLRLFAMQYHGLLDHRMLAVLKGGEKLLGMGCIEGTNRNDIDVGVLGYRSIVGMALGDAVAVSDHG